MTRRNLNMGKSCLPCYGAGALKSGAMYLAGRRGKNGRRTVLRVHKAADPVLPHEEKLPAVLRCRSSESQRRLIGRGWLAALIRCHGAPRRTGAEPPSQQVWETPETQPGSVCTGAGARATKRSTQAGSVWVRGSVWPLDLELAMEILFRLQGRVARGERSPYSSSWCSFSS
ncbi:hypothetical protein NDU88_004543 [Pleurodeles waltl]|uniref:Uncharacterized protein n=1 Tax=Pleurodeles waltl TaxID=8319 RepID=A0AAV7PEE1_PLEWA|nr:hypothetical protein NDU88_004543 [Pleurodeles waltl]